MRAQAKLARHEEEEESAFVSMTDMTVGFLFIMMILLAFFASQMKDPDTVTRSEYDRVVADRNEWEEMAVRRAEEITRLETLKAALELQISDLRAELAQVVEERNRLVRDLKQAQARTEELDEQIRVLLERLAQQNAELERLRELLAELQRSDPLETYLSQVAQARRDVLTRLRDAIKLDFPDLQVELSEESDALRFQGEGLFASGRSDLTTDKRDIAARLAQRLDEVLACFTLGSTSAFDSTCNPGFVMIEAVQIEGHTDDVGTDRTNRMLSAARANSTFFAMTEAAEGVMRHLNLKRQPVLSVAAYGPDRPVVPNDTSQGRATNRRIDLRFIMVTPRDTSGIEVIRNALQNMDDRP